jgi:hypothetical protein
VSPNWSLHSYDIQWHLRNFYTIYAKAATTIDYDRLQYERMRRAKNVNSPKICKRRNCQLYFYRDTETKESKPGLSQWNRDSWNVCWCMFKMFFSLWCFSVLWVEKWIAFGFVTAICLWKCRLSLSVLKTPQKIPIFSPSHPWFILKINKF